MRKPHQLLMWILLFIGCISATQQTPVAEILKTNQYIFVVQQDGQVFIEAEVPSEECPQFMTTMTRDPKYTFTSMHLFRDLDGPLPPMILIVKLNNNFLQVRLFAINEMKLFEQRPRKRYLMFNNYEHAYGRNVKFFTSFSTYDRKLVGVMFDHTRQMIYFDYSTPSKIAIDQFYFVDPFRNSPRVTWIERFEHNTNVTRYNFIEDPYSQTFYYKEKLGNQEFLYRAPLSRFWPIARNEENGTFVRRVPEDVSLDGASGGTYYAVDKQEHRKNSTVTSSLLSMDEEKTMVCEVENNVQDFSNYNKIIVIRDDEYCRLRDGIRYNSDECLAERNRYLTEIGTIKDEDYSALFWLLIVCISLFILLVLLCVYIFWLRSTFVAEDDRSRHHDYDTEASLFVAKQRSFPSAYQDPALLDVSVDKWN